ncbi:MAG: hypothetical protein EBS34_13735 [Flavobacteriales bacterium]|nr:hypothetical protein [Flavobacteriales bacterium]
MWDDGGKKWTIDLDEKSMYIDLDERTPSKSHWIDPIANAIIHIWIGSILRHLKSPLYRFPPQ